MKKKQKKYSHKSKIQVVPKGWGKELWVHNDEKYCGKILVLKKCKQCSLHFHVLKHETFYISTGLVQMETIDKNGVKNTFVMKPGDALEITQGLMHRFKGLEDSEIMEFSTQHFDEDSYRIEKGD